MTFEGTHKAACLAYEDEKFHIERGKRMADTILEVKNLKKYFKTARGTLHAVDDVSFTIERGKTLGIVGESGCGKSTTGRAILRLLEPTSGQVIFDGKDITALKAVEMRKMRSDMQIIFQDPFSSLDPRKTVSQTIAEPIIENKILKDKKAIEARVEGTDGNGRSCAASRQYIPACSLMVEEDRESELPERWR
mgnify:CR=1 FL=1